MKRNKARGIEAIKRRYGIMFVLPWVLGIFLFVVTPLIAFLLYGFSDVTMTTEGLHNAFVGLKHYRRVFVEEPYYWDIFIESLSSLFKSAPIVVALSMILAIVLNQPFKGRALARAVFFLPVIIASGAVMTVVNTFGMDQTLANTAGLSGEATSQYMQVIDFNAILEQLRLPEGLRGLIAGYLSDTFNLIWSCGVQILLFVAGLQTIPAQLYEVGKVEGITAWEEFWYITVPMLGRVIMLVIFYTMVELFIDKSRLVSDAMLQIQQLQYSYTSAMLWPYFAAVGLIIGVVMLIYHTACLKKWE